MILSLLRDFVIVIFGRLFGRKTPDPQVAMIVNTIGPEEPIPHG